MEQLQTHVAELESKLAKSEAVLQDRREETRVSCFVLGERLASADIS